MIAKELIVSVEFLQKAVILLFIMSVIQGIRATYYQNRVKHLENVIEIRVEKYVKDAIKEIKDDRTNN